jgi:hypothetical protein
VYLKPRWYHHSLDAPARLLLPPLTPIVMDQGFGSPLRPPGLARQ